jgi:hypothetical protein
VTLVIQCRKRITVNTDPQRRCYDGHHFKSEQIWSVWSDVCPSASSEDAAASMATFKSINPGHQYRVIESDTLFGEPFTPRTQ